MDPEFKFQWKYNPKSNRLQGFDYSSQWWYFITICTKDRQNFFGEILNGKMILNDFWKIAEKYYLEITKHFPFVILDEFVIMPNHIHGIIIIDTQPFVETKDILFLNENSQSVETKSVETKNLSSLPSSQSHQIPKWTSKTIWSIIRWFKIGVTKYTREYTNIFQIWQPNYYDRIIRNENELDNIRKYIIENPLKWEIDKNNTENIFM